MTIRPFEHIKEFKQVMNMNTTSLAVGRQLKVMFSNFPDLSPQISANTIDKKSRVPEYHKQGHFKWQLLYGQNSCSQFEIFQMLSSYKCSRENIVFKCVYCLKTIWLIKMVVSRNPYPYKMWTYVLNDLMKHIVFFR